MENQVDWNRWLTLIAALTLIFAVAIPIVQKKYEERKAKHSFHLYLKKYFGIIYNILTYDKVEYTIPSIKDNPEKVSLTFPEYLEKFESDFKNHQNTLQPRIGFTLLFNLQNLIIVINRIQLTIIQTDVNKLYEQTLAYGNNLTKKELNKIYGILLLMEHFNSITSFHDKFNTLKSIKRETKKGIITGLIVEKDLLKNQQLIAEDIKEVCNHELSIEEIINVCKLLIQELKGFYNFEKLNKKRQKN